MNSSTLRNLGIVLFALVAILIGLELTEDNAEVTTGQALFGDLRERINDIEQLAVDRPDGEELVITRRADGWVVENRNAFAANVAKVREILLALADARVLEEKTSNPERYSALGVDDPELAGSQGVRLTASGESFEYAVIIGNANQGSGRYVRPAGEAMSLLIDKNPELPENISGWLETGIVDVETSTVATVTLAHADGETIRIEKSSKEDADFSVLEIPDDGELSYPTVANGIAGALNDLELEDVRAASGADEPEASIVYTTFDGLQLTVTAFKGEAEDSTWIALEASTIEPEVSVDEAAADQDSGTSASEGPEARAVAINDRARGREFRIPSFKANLLTRRWNDILKADPATEE